VAAAIRILSPAVGRELGRSAAPFRPQPERRYRHFGRTFRPAPARMVPAFSTGCALAKDAEGERAAELAEMRAIAAGDQAAFGRLIEREGPRLLGFATGLLGNAHEAEDVVQESLIRLWEGAGSWRPDARVGTWLHRVCYNRAVDQLRRRRNFVEDTALEGVPDPGALAEAAMMQGERARSVQDALAALPARQRSAILLFHYQGMPQSEAARIMGISEAALESLLARARRQLRRLLLEGGRGD